MSRQWGRRMSTHRDVRVPRSHGCSTENTCVPRWTTEEARFNMIRRRPEGNSASAAEETQVEVQGVSAWVIASIIGHLCAGGHNMWVGTQADVLAILANSEASTQIFSPTTRFRRVRAANGARSLHNFRCLSLQYEGHQWLAHRRLHPSISVWCK